MRSLVKVVVALAVVALLVVVADRGAEAYAEKRAATALMPTFGATPTVGIDGFPFLDQWSAGSFDRATVRADRVTVEGTRVNDFDMTVSDVSTPAHATSEQDLLASTAGSVRMNGTVPYSALPMPGGVKARRAGDTGNRLRLSGHVSVLGQQIRFTAVVTVTLQNGDARLKPKSVRVLGPLPSAAVTALVRDNLDIVVPPAGLPPGMKISSIRVVDDGLRLHATGHDVKVPKS